MQFDAAYFDAGLDRRDTGCEKWDDRQVMAEGGIPLWVADMDFSCAPAIVQAIRKRAEHPCFGYSCDDPANEEALRAFWLRRHGLAIAPGQSVMLPCVITGLKACVRAFTAPGDGVALFTPVYGPFYESILSNGRRPMRVSLQADGEGRYAMNLQGMEKALADGAKMIMLCNPHNPLSRLWQRQELERLADLAERYQVPMVCDEIHGDFVYKPGVFTPILSVEKARKRAVMLCSASKTFNIAGLQQAAAVAADDEMLQALRQKLSAAGAACGNTFALAATRAAYTGCDAWLDGLINYLDGNRQALKAWVEQHLPQARLTPVEATYLAWLDLRSFGQSCRELTEKCRRAGVAFTMGTFFGEEGEGFLRVNFACPRTQLIAGMERLLLALKEEQ